MDANDESEDGEIEEDEDMSEEVRKNYELELAKSIKKQVKNKKKQEEEEPTVEDYDTWYCCDGCNLPIDGGEFRFDCTTCENFSFCEKCYKRNKTHLHKFTRQKVPP